MRESLHTRPHDNRNTAGHREIAVIEPVGGHAGMNYYNLELARALFQQGIRTRLYTSDETTESSEDGITIIKSFRGIYGAQNRIWRGVKFLSGLRQAISDASNRSIEIAHLHFFQYGLREVACCASLKARGFKIVATFHDIEAFSQPGGFGWLPLILKFTDYALVHNEYSKKRLVAATRDAEVAPPVSVISAGHYLSQVETMERDSARKILSIQWTGPVLLFFGQIKLVKGLDLLLHAFATYKQRGGAAILLIAGRQMTHDKTDYMALSDSLGISDSVIFHSRYVPDQDVSTYFSAADLVVLPYREIYQSAVLFMAMSHARPVLVSNLPQFTEIVEDGVTGFVFPSGSKDMLADKLEESLLDSDRLEEMGESAVNHMKQLYSWEKMAEATSLVYRSITDNQSSPEA